MDIPVEIWSYVFSFLRNQGMGAPLYMTCKLFKQVMLLQPTFGRRTLYNVNMALIYHKYTNVFKWYYELIKQSQESAKDIWSYPDQERYAMNRTHMLMAICKGCTKIVQYLLDEGIIPTDECFERAIRLGNKKVINLLKDRFEVSNFNLISINQHPKFIGYCKRIGLTINKDSCYHAARLGNINLYKFFEEQCDLAVMPSVAKYAANFNRRKMLIWLRDNDRDITGTFQGAIMGEHWELIPFLFEGGFPIDKLYNSNIHRLCRHAPLETIQYVFVHIGYNKTNDIYVIGACSSGRLDVVKYLFSKGFICGSRALGEAAKTGNKELVVYLLDGHADVNVKTLENCARGGNIAIMDILLDKYEHDLGPINLCDSACARKQWKMAKYLQSKGFIYSSISLKYTVIFNEVEMFEYLIAEGCPITFVELEKACIRNRTQMALRLLDLDCPITTNCLYTALKIGNRILIKALVEHNCPIDISVFTLDLPADISKWLNSAQLNWLPV